MARRKPPESAGPAPHEHDFGPASPESPVSLRGRSEMPVVLGVPQDVLTRAQYDVVEALVKAGPAGLSLRELAEASGRRYPNKTLDSLLARGGGWVACVKMAGQAHSRYRITWPDRSPGIDAALRGELPADPEARMDLVEDLMVHASVLMHLASEIQRELFQRSRRNRK